MSRLPPAGGSGTAAGLRAVSLSAAAALAGLTVALVMVVAAGESPVDALRALADGAFGSRQQTASTLAKTVPLVVVALGWIVCSTTRRVNIGLDGQAILGAVGAAAVGLHLAGPGILVLPAAVVVAAVAGAAWAGIAAWLWARRGVNEIIATLLLNLIAIQVLAWTIRGPLQASRGAAVRTDPVRGAARWPTLLGGTPLGWDVVLVPVVAVAVWIVLRRSVFGYRLRLTGANPVAAARTGVSTTRASAAGLLVSGALGGIAGSSLVLAGQTHTLTDNITGGVGYVGIVVALLARNQPIAVVPAALLLAALQQGGGVVEARVGVSSEVVGVLQGVVILAVAGSAIFADRVAGRIGRRPDDDPSVSAEPVGAAAADHAGARPDDLRTAVVDPRDLVVGEPG